MNKITQAPTDAEGYLIDPDDWNEHIAIELAKAEGIALDDSFWSVMNFVRGFYNEHKIAPDVRHLIDCLAEENECDKKEAKEIVFKMFPYGYVKQACKIAGMKRPRAWSTG